MGKKNLSGIGFASSDPTEVGAKQKDFCVTVDPATDHLLYWNGTKVSYQYADGQVVISANDTTAAHLLAKLVTGYGVTKTELNDSSNETLEFKLADLAAAFRFYSHNGTANATVELAFEAFNLSSFSGTNPNKYKDLTTAPISAIMIGVYIQEGRMTQTVDYNIVTDGVDLKRLQMNSRAVPASGQVEVLYLKAV